MKKIILTICLMLPMMFSTAKSSAEQNTTLNDDMVYGFKMQDRLVSDFKIKNNGTSVEITFDGETLVKSSPKHFTIECKNGMWMIDLSNNSKENASISYFINEEKNSTWAILSGYLGTSLGFGLKAIKAKHPNLKVLYLENITGSSDAEIGGVGMKFIMDNEISTYIPKGQFVSSTGADLFMAGKKRFAEKGSEITIHYFGDYGSVENSIIIDKYFKKLYKRAGIKSSFYSFMKSIPSNELYKMSPNDLKKYNFINTTKNEFIKFVGGGIY